MTYTILSAQYANADGTAVVAQTEECGAVAIAPERAVLWAKLQAWVTAGGVIEPLPEPHPNAAIDAQIDAVYAEAPFSQRALTELAWAMCSIRDIQDQQITALVNVIREIGGPSYASFDVPRVPDLKRNKGMLTVKDQIDRTKALRAQKQ